MDLLNSSSPIWINYTISSQNKDVFWTLLHPNCDDVPTLFWCEEDGTLCLRSDITLDQYLDTLTMTPAIEVTIIMCSWIDVMCQVLCSVYRSQYTLCGLIISLSNIWSVLRRYFTDDNWVSMRLRAQNLV